MLHQKGSFLPLWSKATKVGIKETFFSLFSLFSLQMFRNQDLYIPVLVLLCSTIQHKGRLLFVVLEPSYISTVCTHVHAYRTYYVSSVICTVYERSVCQRYETRDTALARHSAFFIIAHKGSHNNFPRHNKNI